MSGWGGFWLSLSVVVASNFWLLGQGYSTTFFGELTEQDKRMQEAQVRSLEQTCKDE